MDDQTQSDPADLTELQARHESAHQPMDAMDVALLFNAVGSELTKVDSQSVSPSTKSAMQLTKEKVFSGFHDNRQPQQVSTQSVPTPAHPPPPEVHQPIPVPPTAPPRVSSVTEVGKDVEKRIVALEKSLKRVESFSNAYRKAKKIKRGAKYSVSSNSMKGEIKDADVLLEYVLCEISKGVKSITIKICED